MEKKLLGRFVKRNCKRQIKHKFRGKKVIKKKSDKLYVNSKDYNNLFNSWIDKKDIII